MSHAFTIDPELRVLLQEIAEDPRAKLLRTEIPRPERLVLARFEPVGAAAPRLTSAERQLLLVYREETARILRDAAEWKLQQDPLGAAQVSLHTDATNRRVVSDREELLALFDGRLHPGKGLMGDSALNREVRLSRSLLATPATAAVQYAGLSLRLVPHDVAWIHLGRAALLERSFRPALQSLASVVHRPQSPALRSAALSWMGVAYGMVGSSCSAAQAYSAAAGVSDPAPIILISGLHEALLAGDRAAALRAAERIDACIPLDSPCLAEWTEKLKLRKHIEPGSTAGSHMRAGSRWLAELVGQPARMVIHAIE